jgi:hypothetical protein
VIGAPRTTVSLHRIVIGLQKKFPRPAGMNRAGVPKRKAGSNGLAGGTALMQARPWENSVVAEHFIQRVALCPRICDALLERLHIVVIDSPLIGELPRRDSAQRPENVSPLQYASIASCRRFSSKRDALAYEKKRREGDRALKLPRAFVEKLQRMR